MKYFNYSPSIPDPNHVIETYFNNPSQLLEVWKNYHAQVAEKEANELQPNGSAITPGTTRKALQRLHKEVMEHYPDHPALGDALKPTSEHYKRAKWHDKKTVNSTLTNMRRVSASEADKVIDISEKLLMSASEYDVILGVVALTGKRPAEAMLANFEVGERGLLKVSNLCKKKSASSEYDSYLVFPHTDAELIIQATSRIHRADIDAKHFNNSFATPIRRRFAKFFSTFSFLEKPYDLRSFYCEYFLYRNAEVNNLYFSILTGSDNVQHETIMRRILLSHEDNNDKDQLNYAKFKIVRN
jgi:hypothetical protein